MWIIKGINILHPEMFNVLPGDICVDLDSQKAVGYNGIVNFVKKFTPSNSNTIKRSQDDICVVHNLETYDNDFHQLILGIIDIGKRKDTHVVYNENNIEAQIVSYYDMNLLIKQRKKIKEQVFANGIIISKSFSKRTIFSII